MLLETVGHAAPEISPADLFTPKKLAHNITFPASIARVESSHEGDSDELIYLIQDAHTNDSGQLNLGRTLELLLEKDKDLEHVYVEGGFGDVSLSRLRRKGDRETRRREAMSYLRKGTLHGEEYLDLTSQREFSVWGVEDRDLYQQSVEAYRQTASLRADGRVYLGKIRLAIDVLKGQIWNKDLLDFEEAKSAYLSETAALSDYLRILNEHARQEGISLLGYPELASLRSLREAEADIDFAAANVEHAAAVRSLQARERNELQVLTESRAKAGPFGVLHDEGQSGYFARLEESLGEARSSFPELSKYLDYLKRVRAIRPERVMDEMSGLEAAVESALTHDADERTLLDCSKALRNFEKLASLAFIPSEYRSYAKFSKEFDVRRLTGFLNRKIMEAAGPYERATFLDERFEQMIAAAERFYELTARRDEAFLRTMEERMRQAGVRRAVLITGGYHTPNLKNALRSRGASYISIQPQVYQETNLKKYESVLLGQSLPGVSSQARPAMARPVSFANTPDLPVLERTLDGARLSAADPQKVVAFPQAERPNKPLHEKLLPQTLRALLEWQLFTGRITKADHQKAHADLLRREGLPATETRRGARPAEGSLKSKVDPNGARLAGVMRERTRFVVNAFLELAPESSLNNSYFAEALGLNLWMVGLYTQRLEKAGFLAHERLASKEYFLHPSVAAVRSDVERWRRFEGKIRELLDADITDNELHDALAHEVSALKQGAREVRTPSGGFRMVTALFASMLTYVQGLNRRDREPEDVIEPEVHPNPASSNVEMISTPTEFPHGLDVFSRAHHVFRWVASQSRYDQGFTVAQVARDVREGRLILHSLRTPYGRLTHQASIHQAVEQAIWFEGVHRGLIEKNAAGTFFSFTPAARDRFKGENGARLAVFTGPFTPTQRVAIRKGIEYAVGAVYPRLTRVYAERLADQLESTVRPRKIGTFRYLGWMVLLKAHPRIAMQAAGGILGVLAAEALFYYMDMKGLAPMMIRAQYVILILLTRNIIRTMHSAVDSRFRRGAATAVAWSDTRRSILLDVQADEQRLIEDAAHESVHILRMQARNTSSSIIDVPTAQAIGMLARKAATGSYGSNLFDEKDPQSFFSQLLLVSFVRELLIKYPIQRPVPTRILLDEINSYTKGLVPSHALENSHEPDHSYVSGYILALYAEQSARSNLFASRSAILSALDLVGQVARGEDLLKLSSSEGARLADVKGFIQGADSASALIARLQEVEALLVAIDADAETYAAVRTIADENVVRIYEAEPVADGQSNADLLLSQAQMRLSALARLSKTGLVSEGSLSRATQIMADRFYEFLKARILPGMKVEEALKIARDANANVAIRIYDGSEYFSKEFLTADQTADLRRRIENNIKDNVRPVTAQEPAASNADPVTVLDGARRIEDVVRLQRYEAGALRVDYAVGMKIGVIADVQALGVAYVEVPHEWRVLLAKITKIDRKNGTVNFRFLDGDGQVIQKIRPRTAPIEADHLGEWVWKGSISGAAGQGARLSETTDRIHATEIALKSAESSLQRMIASRQDFRVRTATLEKRESDIRLAERQGGDTLDTMLERRKSSSELTKLFEERSRLRRDEVALLSQIEAKTSEIEVIRRLLSQLKVQYEAEVQASIPLEERALMDRLATLMGKTARTPNGGRIFEAVKRHLVAHTHLGRGPVQTLLTFVQENPDDVASLSDLKQAQGVILPDERLSEIRVALERPEFDAILAEAEQMEDVSIEEEEEMVPQAQAERLLAQAQAIYEGIDPVSQFLKNGERDVLGGRVKDRLRYEEREAIEKVMKDVRKRATDWAAGRYSVRNLPWSGRILVNLVLRRRLSDETPSEASFDKFRRAALDTSGELLPSIREQFEQAVPSYRYGSMSVDVPFAYDSVRALSRVRPAIVPLAVAPATAPEPAAAPTKPANGFHSLSEGVESDLREARSWAAQGRIFDAWTRFLGAEAEVVKLLDAMVEYVSIQDLDDAEEAELSRLYARLEEMKSEAGSELEITALLPIVDRFAADLADDQMPGVPVTGLSVDEIVGMFLEKYPQSNGWKPIAAKALVGAVSRRIVESQERRQQEAVRSSWEEHVEVIQSGLQEAERPDIPFIASVLAEITDAKARSRAVSVIQSWARSLSPTRDSLERILAADAQLPEGLLSAEIRKRERMGFSREESVPAGPAEAPSADRPAAQPVREVAVEERLGSESWQLEAIRTVLTDESYLNEGLLSGAINSNPSLLDDVFQVVSPDRQTELSSGEVRRRLEKLLPLNAVKAKLRPRLIGELKQSVVPEGQRQAERMYQMLSRRMTRSSAPAAEILTLLERYQPLVVIGRPDQLYEGYKGAKPGYLSLGFDISLSEDGNPADIRELTIYLEGELTEERYVTMLAHLATVKMMSRFLAANKGEKPYPSEDLKKLVQLSYFRWLAELWVIAHAKSFGLTDHETSILQFESAIGFLEGHSGSTPKTKEIISILGKESMFGEEWLRYAAIFSDIPSLTDGESGALDEFLGLLQRYDEGRSDETPQQTEQRYGPLLAHWYREYFQVLSRVTSMPETSLFYDTKRQGAAKTTAFNDMIMHLNDHTRAVAAYRRNLIPNLPSAKAAEAVMVIEDVFREQVKSGSLYLTDGSRAELKRSLKDRFSDADIEMAILLQRLLRAERSSELTRYATFNSVDMHYARQYNPSLFNIAVKKTGRKTRMDEEGTVVILINVDGAEGPSKAAAFDGVKSMFYLPGATRAEDALLIQKRADRSYVILASGALYQITQAAPAEDGLTRVTGKLDARAGTEGYSEIWKALIPGLPDTFLHTGSGARLARSEDSRTHEVLRQIARDPFRRVGQFTLRGLVHDKGLKIRSLRATDDEGRYLTHLSSRYDALSEILKTAIASGDITEIKVPGRIRRLYEFTEKGVQKYAKGTLGARLSETNAVDPSSGASLAEDLPREFDRFFVEIAGRFGSSAALAMETDERIRVYTLMRQPDKLVVTYEDPEQGSQRKVYDLTSDRLRRLDPSESADALRAEDALTDHLDSVMRANSLAAQPAAALGHPVRLVIHLDSLGAFDKAVLSNLFYHWKARLSVGSVVVLAGSEHRLAVAERVVREMALKDFVTEKELSADQRTFPDAHLVTQGYLGQNPSLRTEHPSAKWLFLEKVQGRDAAVFGFAPIGSLLELAARGQTQAAFSLYMALAPQYRKAMTYEDLLGILGGDESLAARFPLPALLKVDFREAVRLYRMSRMSELSA